MNQPDELLLFLRTMNQINQDTRRINTELEKINQKIARDDNPKNHEHPQTQRHRPRS